MKFVFYILAVVCLCAIVTQAQKQKKPRIIFVPPSYLKAEAFIEFSESDREVYVAGLMDGFFASTFFGASDETVANLTSCTKDMDTKQIAAIITKYVKDHPESWHLPVNAEAHTALNAACPGGLKVIDRNN